MNRRLAYLDALGVDVWVPRDSVPPARASALEASSAAPPVAHGPAPEVTSSSAASPTHAPTNAPTPESTQQPAIDTSPLDLSGADWSELEQRVAACRRCALCEGRTNTVFGVGDRKARWMIIGEAPGAEEDRRGEPFVGRAGQLLDAMLKAAGFARSDVFIANVLKCRPPNNRDPSNAEAAACAPYLARQIQLLQPDLILAVGRIAAQRLLESTDPLGKLRGRVHEHAGGVPVVVTYHPAYLLRSPSQKRKAWEDLLFAHRTAAGRVAGH